MEDLAHFSGATVRTIRAYQDRGLLPRPERRGRANVYGDAHLARLRQIADLLDRGYTLASIKDLLAAWDAGRDLGGVLGLVAEIDGPWTDEEASRISRTDLDAAFGGSPDETALTEAEAAEAATLVRRLRPLAQQTIDAELARAMRTLATRSLRHHLSEARPSEARRPAGNTAEAGAATGSVAEAGAATGSVAEAGAATGSVAEAGAATGSVPKPRPASHLSPAPVPAPRPVTDPRTPATPAALPEIPETVLLPAETVQAVRDLVGADNTAAFIATAAHREVQARTMDALVAGGSGRADGLGTRDRGY
ncbi:MerR family transcriptional regulator [Streptomyces tubercidicus]|uniref:MerR family transcriptional regulator n=1 Tax=Streptomyces tubercidicus TaxID=47759 RepID=UPI0036BA95CA